MDKQSLADMAVETLAAVSSMDYGVELEHPERHAIRELKYVANEILENAFREARRLAFAASSVREAAREAAREADRARQ